LDIDQWLDACVSADMTYAILTVKHHDGFVIYPTAYHTDGHTPHSIAQTDWYANNGQLDIVAQFVAKCRTKGLTPGLYYSIWDKCFEVETGTDETTNAAGYIAMIQAQLTELLSNYGSIGMMWFDGWGWEIGYEEIPYASIYNHVKSLQPDCVVVENAHVHPSVTSQVETYEQNEYMIPAFNLRPSEYVETIRTDGWFYRGVAAEGNLKETALITGARTTAISRNGTHLLGISPASDGHLSAGQITKLGELGA
jgi:alpha-L-fucosidase